MKLIERFTARADDDSVYHIECWRDDTGVQRYAMADGESIIQVEGATLEVILRGILLHRALAKHGTRDLN